MPVSCVGLQIFTQMRATTYERSWGGCRGFGTPMQRACCGDWPPNGAVELRAAGRDSAILSIVQRTRKHSGCRVNRSEDETKVPDMVLVDCCPAVHSASSTQHTPKRTHLPWDLPP